MGGPPTGYETVQTPPSGRLRPRFPDSASTSKARTVPSDVPTKVVLDGSHPSCSSQAQTATPASTEQSLTTSTRAPVRTARLPAMRNPSASDADELLAWCRAGMAGYKKPSRFEFCDDLPRNSMGKTDKAALRAPYWAGRDRSIGG